MLQSYNIVQRWHQTTKKRTWEQYRRIVANHCSLIHWTVSPLWLLSSFWGPPLVFASPAMFFPKRASASECRWRTMVRTCRKWVVNGMRVIDHFLTAIFFGGGIWGGSFISSLAVLCCHSKLRPVFGSRIQRKRIQNQIFTTHPWWRKHGAFKCRGAPFEMLGGIWWDVRNVWLLLLWPLKIGEGLRAYHFSPGASTRHFWW
jgi:hypothetical protein